MVSAHGAWDTDGCTTVLSDQTNTICECELYGKYAVIAELVEDPYVEEEDDWLTVMKYIGFSVSIPCIVVLVVIIGITRLDQ